MSLFILLNCLHIIFQFRFQLFSISGLGKSVSKVTSSSGATGTVTTNLVTAMTSPNWAGTSWSGGLSQGCSAAFRTSTTISESGTGISLYICYKHLKQKLKFQGRKNYE